MRQLAYRAPLPGRDDVSQLAAAPPGPPSLYRLIWTVAGRDQLWLCLLTIAIVPLSMVPLELQRRITNEAIGGQDTGLLAGLGAVYLLVILVQGGLKYLLNLRRGRVVELVALELRRQIHATVLADGEVPAYRRGALVSMTAAEAEDVAGFVAESLSVPLLQGGTILAVLGYLMWLEPLIAGLVFLLYLPELVIVPWQQQTINRLSRAHIRLLRAMGGTIVGGAAGRRGAAAGGFLSLAARAFAVRLAIYRLKYVLTFLGNLLDAAGPMAVLVIGGWLVVRGQATMGVLVVSITALQRFGDPLDQLMTYYRTAQNARVKYALLSDSMRLRHEERPGETAPG